VAVGSSPSVAIRFSPGVVGVNNYRLQVTTAEEDSSPGDNAGLALFTVEAASDLALYSSAAPATVPLNQEFVVVFAVTNLGSLAVDAAFAEALPASTAFVSALS